MLIGLTVEKYRGVEPSVLIAFVKKMGVEFVEVTKSVFEDLENVIPLLKDMSVGFHLPLVHDDGYDFSCPDFKMEIDRMIDMINVSWQDLNLIYCVAHPPEPHRSRTPLETSVPFLLDNLGRLKSPILIENVPGVSFRDFQDLYSEAKRNLGDKLQGFCFDVAHSFLNREDWTMWLSDFNPELKCIHLSDCSKSEDLHLPFGQGGELPLQELLAFLKEHKFAGIIDLELMPQSLRDLKPVINSYLAVLKHFKKGKYYLTKARLLLILPFIQRLLP